MDNAENIDLIADFIPAFLDDCRDKLRFLESAVPVIEQTGRNHERYSDFVRTVHSLKGTAPIFGFSTLGIIAHKLEDYLSAANLHAREKVSNIFVYIDRMARVVDLGRNPDAETETAILRGLPSAIDLDDFSLTQHLIQALFVGPKNMQFRIFEKELKASGFNVTNAQNSFQAIEIAVRMRPDVILVCNVIDILGGTEVAHVLHAIKATAHIPTMFITSDLLDDGHDRDRIKERLPPGIEIVRKTHFADDFADAVMALGII